MSAQQWSQQVQALLVQLRNGPDVAIPSQYYGPNSFSHLAKAYLSNAVSLCREGFTSDFKVFMAFYGIRHGLELWLKCILRNVLIDRGLSQLCKGASFEDIAAASLRQMPARRERQAGKDQLQRALCAFRNYHQDGLVAPAMWELHMEDTWIAKAIECVRSREQESRWSFAFMWQLPLASHDLAPLWSEVRDRIDDAKSRVCVYVQEAAGLVEPAEMAILDATIEMLSALDATGDAFRYPYSNAGEWYNKLPNVSLARLADFAELLEETVRAYDSYFEEAYTHSTIRSPWPAELCGF